MKWLSWLLAALVSAFALASACGSPLVGLECKPGLGRCEGGCFDFSEDENHCGGCGIACGEGEQCIDAVCTPEEQEQDAGVDAGPIPDAAVSDGGVITPPPVCMGPGSAENCVCGIGQLKCGDTCRNVASDPEHCGECGRSCGGGFCVNGMCSPACDPPLTQCGTQCVDLQNDPFNCGRCNNVCESGLCAEGECLGPTAGHVVVMGHDLTRSTAATRRLLGNAVFLPLTDPVKVLTFDEQTSSASKAGEEAAIMNRANATSRNYELTSATPLAVTFLLSMSDVFVIEAQPGATNSSLNKNGETWSLALQQFLKRGGVIVLMEGPGGSNDGTYQILRTAGLFDAAARVPVGRKQLTLTAPADGVATAVPTLYQGGDETMGFDTSESTVVVADESTGVPVVIHIAQ